ncbi:arsenate reductase/protein-tyrosine-phosphatase family protein [Demequina mangrovi]|uniref:Protein-tyrosine-phosphatase n=1 Tax=Demequina mangrovi TaxID=1043493 RepID=A0A1H6YV97_9MICO|nr:MarR family transcriptional regulator [Demequina mangrovi]SEJ41272.1 Protein-tyrosine-phosphatase [Demequina mangrovi]
MSDRIAVLGALADPHRLALVDALADSDLAPGELAERSGLASSLLAHHVRVLERAGVVVRRRSDADRRRSYLALVWSPLVAAAVGARDGTPETPAARVVFSCTGNSARSQMAAALLAAERIVPVASGGTDPAVRIHPLALDELARRGLAPVSFAPARLDEVRRDGDLVVAVCDLAYEECGGDVHWSVPDPAVEGTSRAFAAAFDALAPRVRRLAADLAAPARSRSTE